MSTLNLAPRALAQIHAPSPHAGIWKLAMLIVILVALASILSAIAIVTGLLAQPLPSKRPQVTGFVTYQIATITEQSTRKVYPYSIVPGGAETLDEARRAFAEPRFQSLCSEVDLAKLRLVKLRKNLVGYISYRVGDQIYWTSHVVTLHAGETAFTDGVYLMRGRGLNCYSPLPMLPTRTDEPAEQVLDTPNELPEISYSFAKVPVQAPHLPPRPGELAPSFPFFNAAAPAPASPLIPPIRGRWPAPPAVGVTPEPRSR